MKKEMKSRGGTGESSVPLPRFYFLAPLFTSHHSPLSERLEQATHLDLGKLRSGITIHVCYVLKQDELVLQFFL